MHYFMNFGEPIAKIEPLNTLDPDTYCPKFRLTIEMDFSAPGQEDGHGPAISRENDLSAIMVHHLAYARKQIEEEIKRNPV